jgi:hypothetical protein
MAVQFRDYYETVEVPLTTTMTRLVSNIANWRASVTRT